MSAVQVSEISLYYGDTAVLDQCSLVVQPGEYLVVLGKSGCGKTSLLRVIAGLAAPFAGSIFLAGEDVTHLPARNRDIALVPQNNGLYPHMSIGESIRLGIREKLSRQETQRRVHSAAEMVGLVDFLDRLPNQLSGGQVRRAALAKAIAKQASVRLLDEPLSAIDAANRFQIERDLLHLHRSLEGVTLHVTHDGREAMRLADRIAMIEDRQIVQCGAPREVFFDPASISIAETLGASPLVQHPVQFRNGVWEMSGIVVRGPIAPEGTSAIVAFYEEDRLPIEKIESAGELGWQDPKGVDAVAAKNLRWFTPQGKRLQVSSPL